MCYVGSPVPDFRRRRSRCDVEPVTRSAQIRKTSEPTGERTEVLDITGDPGARKGEGQAQVIRRRSGGKEGFERRISR